MAAGEAQTYQVLPRQPSEKCRAGAPVPVPLVLVSHHSAPNDLSPAQRKDIGKVVLQHQDGAASTKVTKVTRRTTVAQHIIETVAGGTDACPTLPNSGNLLGRYLTITEGYWWVPLTKAAPVNSVRDSRGSVSVHCSFSVHGTPATLRRMMERLLCPHQGYAAASLAGSLSTQRAAWA